MTLSRPLSQSGLSTPRLVLGGNVFGWTADRDAGFAVLDAFVDGGGVMIDTADVYSAWIEGHRGGESERMIGEWLKASGKRDQVLIATKVGMLPGEGGDALEPARIAAAAEASLARLGTDRIDLYYAHKDDADTPLGDTLGAFDALVKAGKVRAIGASNYSAARLTEALDTSAANGLTAFSVLQPLYNLVERDAYEGALQDLCVARGIAAVPYSGLASGFLTGKYRSKDDVAGKPRGNAVSGYLDGNGPAVLAALDAVADDAGAKPAQVALAWLAAQPGVAAPIASATSVEQVHDLLGAMRLTLSEAQLRQLDEASR